MAIATTGPLALKLTIRAEELIKNSSLTPTDVSTREISESAGFSEPDAFSEFYGYSSAILPTMASIRVSGGPNDSYIAFAATPATTGFVALTSRGFYFGTDYRGPQYNTRYQVDTSNSLGEFSKGFGGLAGATTYYCWGYVQNQIGEAYTARSQGTTQRVIPITTSEGSYFQLLGPVSLVGECVYTCSYEGFNMERFKEFTDSSNAVTYFDCMYLDTDQRAYLDYAYLHPYYGWVGNGGVYAHRYDSASKCYYSPSWSQYGWGETNHSIYSNFTMKRADGGATRQRNQMHTDNYISRNGGYGGYIQLVFEGAWFRRDTGYFGSHTGAWDRSGSIYYSPNSTSVDQYSNGHSGGYAPYYSWMFYQYTYLTMNHYYSSFRVNNDDVGYFYSN